MHLPEENRGENEVTFSWAKISQIGQKEHKLLKMFILTNLKLKTSFPKIF